MKILLVVTGLEIGGAERQVVDLADELAVNGNQIQVAYFLGVQKVFPKNNSVEFIALGKNKRNIMAFVYGLFNLIDLIKLNKPDVVHAHMFHSIILTRISRFFTRIPMLVCTSHSSYDGGKLRMLAYRGTSFLGDIFTNVSQKAVDNLEKRGAIKKGSMIAVLNGINLSDFYRSDEKRILARTNLDKNKKLLLSVGRFHEAKDYPNLLKAFSLVCTKRDDVELWIVGDGQLRGEIESLIIKLNLQNKVKLLGIRNDIPELMNAADIYVLSSAWEGFGLVVAEAMATERVVVATNCGGVKEVVGDCGFLVSVSDPTALSNSIIYSLSLNESETTQLGEKARLRIENNYSIEQVTKKWLTIYNGTYE